MKPTKTVLIILFTTATLAAATDYYERFFITSNDTMYVTDMEFDVLEVVDLPSNTEAVTFDGERWWMVYNDSEIYAFDLNGDYVTSFPAPEPGIKGMAWDGACIWMVVGGSPDWIFYLYERYPDGSVGPHGDFIFDDVPASVGGLAYENDELLVLGYTSSAYWVFSRDGTFLYSSVFEHYTGGRYDRCRGICFADPDYDWGYGGPYFFFICDQPIKLPDDIIVIIHTGEFFVWGGGIPDSDGFGSGIEYGKIQYDYVVKESFGRIKAYFANQ
jgi:hypothetical protein